MRSLEVSSAKEHTFFAGGQEVSKELKTVEKCAQKKYEEVKEREFNEELFMASLENLR